MLRKIRKEELGFYAQLANWELAENEVEEYARLVDALFPALDALDDEAPLPPPVAATSRRDAGRKPEPGEDPCNAIIRWCDVQGAGDGPLAGKRIGLKDNVAVAGVPMTFACKLMEPYVCEADAIVTERILDAGGQVVAKLNLESFAWSGGGETSGYGAVLNPWDRTRTAAGSSGGSGAALFYDGIDMTIGTDQGGSIRLPASWCGVLGLKPTHGLIPYVGIGAIDVSYDHAGPMTRTVEDMALLLDVVAGKHPDDPRQDVVPRQEYRKAVAEAPDDLKGVTVGVLKEGFGFAADPAAPAGTAETEAAVREAIERLRALGAEVREVSVPMHLTGTSMMFAALMMGQTELLRNSGVYFHARGARQSPDLALALGRSLRTQADLLPPTVKLVTLLGGYMKEYYFGAHYAKAMNLAPKLRAAYDRALAECDVIVMPTATHYAHVHLPEASLSERVLRGWGMVSNTAPTDATGHPALSIPAAEADGLPVGVMLVGRTFDDAGLLRIARTYERAYGWLPGSAPSYP